MDPQRFDTLVKTLSTTGTRRGALAALLSGSLSLLGLPQTAQGRKRRGGHGDDDFTIEGPCGDGSGPDNACKRNRDCCTGICERTRPNKPKRCRCRRRGQDCTETRNCCQAAGQDLVCDGGTCQPHCDPACGECERCVRGACVEDEAQEGQACGTESCLTCQGGSCQTAPNGTVCGAGGDPSFCCTAGACPEPSGCRPGGTPCEPGESGEECAGRCCAGFVQGPSDQTQTCYQGGYGIACESQADCVSGHSCQCGTCCLNAGEQGVCDSNDPFGIFAPQACCSGACDGTVCAA